MNKITLTLKTIVRAKAVLLLLLFGVNFSVFAQESTVGINTLSPDPSAVLEVFSTSKGFLPPRLTTNQRDAMNSQPAGLIIYNSDLDCLQYWNGTKWFGQCIGSEDLFFGDCSTGAVSGVFGKDVVMTNENTLTLAVTVTELGPWSVFSEAVNGIFFSGNGIFNAIGVQNITLTANGTPLADGDFNFSIHMNTSVCVKVINFSAPPPEPNMTADSNGLKLPYSDSGTIMIGTVNELPVSATFSNYIGNVNSSNYNGAYCGVNTNTEAWGLGSSENSSMTIKFNRLVTNLKVFQNAANKGETVTYVLKRIGSVVSGNLQLSTAYSQNCNADFVVAGTQITFITPNPNKFGGALYNVGGAWFDEIEIKHNGVGGGSRFGFYLESAK